MLILNSNTTGTNQVTSRRLAAPTEVQADAANAQQDTFESGGLSAKSLVAKGAYAAGGALGGTGLGVVTGLALSNLSGNPVFGQLGGVIGIAGGVAAGLAASKGDLNKEALTRSVGSWVGASAGASGGMWALGAIGGALAQNGASAVLATSGALMGAAAGGLVGAALPFIGVKGPISNTLKNTAAVVGGGVSGAMLGGTAQSLVTSMAGDLFSKKAKEAGMEAAQYLAQNVPQLSTVLAPIPLMLGVVGAFSTLSGTHTGSSKTGKALVTARDAGIGSTIGYGVGAAVGGVINAFGATTAYSIGTPIVGAAIGSLIALDGHRSDKTSVYATAAGTTALAAVGVGVGDAIGHGLTALTGNPLYSQIGAIAGGANGLVGGLRANDVNKNGFEVVTGLVSGGASGALLGAGISALTGQPIWNTVMPILGAAAGTLTGLALALDAKVG